jgi:2-methylcitrate dehydratase PrpD
VIGAAAPGAALLAFVAETPFEALPKPAVEMGRLATLDWWGVTVGGVDEPVARLLREAVPEPGGPASVLGTDRTASPVTAALWNGTASHALDYDDTVLALPGHVTAPLLPGLLALAEARGASGRDVLTAFVLGVEVMCRVSRALAPGHYRAGWHATATLGRLGGAAACARLLGLDALGIDHAVGLAAAQLAGIHESFRTMGKTSRSVARRPTGSSPRSWPRTG